MKTKEQQRAYMREYKREWCAKNHEHIKAYRREWYAENKDKHAIYMARYYAKKIAELGLQTEAHHD